MGILGEKKYKLLRKELVANRLDGVSAMYLHRIKALVDIPRYGVKKGDLGGYVLDAHNLSHSGDCWIGGEAQVLESVFISGNAYVGDNAIIDGQGNLKISIFDNVKITGNARISCWSPDNKSNEEKVSSTFFGNFEVSGDAKVFNLESGSGNAKVYGEATIWHSQQISGEAEVYGYARIDSRVKILGNSKVYDYGVVEKNAALCDSVVSGHGKALKGVTYTNEVITTKNDGSALVFPRKENSFPAVTSPAPVSSVTEDLDDLSVLDEYNEIVAEINAYQTDIVKIIKYPVMTDSSDPNTLNMSLAFKKAKRLSRKPDSPAFADAVEDLEAKFAIAESNALKIAATKLSDADQKKVKLAKEILNKASNEASTEHEKKVAFAQGFKQLEGIIAVPEVAMDTFRIKIGLKELET